MLGMPDDPGARAGARARWCDLAPVSARRRGRGLARAAGRLPARPADRPRGHGHPRATCAAPRPRAAGRARCSTRSSSSTTTATMPADPRGRARRRAARERARRRERPKERGPAPRAALAAARPSAAGAVARRRRPALAALLLIVLVWPVGLLTGGDDDGEPAADERSSAAQERRPAASATGGRRDAHCGHRHGGRAQRQAPAIGAGASSRPARSARRTRCGSTTAASDARSLGAPGHRSAGHVPGPRATARRTSSDYRYIDVSRESVDQNREHSGDSVLRGPLDQLRTAERRRQQAAALGQSAPQPPAG